MTTSMTMGGVTLKAGGGKVALADVSTKRLTLTFQPQSSSQPGQVQVRLDGQIIATPITIGGTINGQTIGIGTPFSLTIALDGAPATTTGGTDHQIVTPYTNLQVGGYYLIGTGGYTSNWSQVHRAAGQLLAVNNTPYAVDGSGNPIGGFPIVCATGTTPVNTPCNAYNPVSPTNPGGITAYVDINNSGTYQSNDSPLLGNVAAQDALTGGLLYVAMSQYFAQFTDKIRSLDALDHIITPIEGFVGMVSSTYQVQYLNNTAFSIMPGGLLIDMKGQSFDGSFRIDQSTLSSATNNHVELLGHMMSSLEHETWQELTGFDAVSTVRGIQMALANGAALQTPASTGTTNNMASQYTAFQYNNPVGAAPAGFTYTPFTIFATQPATWTNGVSGAQMELLKSSVASTTSSLRRSLATYVYSTTSGLYAWVSCVANQVTILQNAQNTNPNGVYSITFCDGVKPPNGTPSYLLGQLENDYLTNIIPNAIGQTYFNFFDRAQGFNAADYAYRTVPLAANQHAGSSIQSIRDDVMIGPTDPNGYLYANAYASYVLPNYKTQGSSYLFSVDLKQIFSSAGSLSNLYFLISNDSVSAGGGWVDGSNVLQAATSISGTTVIKPTFSNTIFTDKNLVSVTNNNLIRTPSTADPVSTVTGNMYHDETDFTIKGRGLNYAFTRSYNSGPARSNLDGPLGYGWTHSYNMSLRANDYGACPNCAPGTGAGQAPENGNGKTSSITFIDERGGEHTYLVNESTFAVTPPPGEFDTLDLSTSSTTGVMTLTYRNGTKYVFTGPSGTSALKTMPGQVAQLTSISDPYGNTLTMSYAASTGCAGGTLLCKITDNLGIAGRTGLAFTYYTGTNHIQTISDWTGRTWTYSYDSQGNLASITNAMGTGFTETYTYYAGAANKHLLKASLLPELRTGQQVQTVYQYYQDAKAFKYQDALGNTTTLDYDLYRQRTQVTDPRGFITQYLYDTNNGQLTQLNEPDGGVLQFANNTDGLRYQKIDGLGYKTQYSYQTSRAISSAASNNNGLVSRETDPLNQNTDTSYGLYDQPTTVVDKRGNATTRDYYASGFLMAGKLQDVKATVNGTVNVLLSSYTYYTDNTQKNYGQIKQKIEYIDPANPARQRITNYVYDATGINLVSVTVSGATSGGTITKTYGGYDALGRPATETLTRRTSATNSAMVNLTTTFGYDNLDRVISVKNPIGDNHQTVYDKNGKVISESVVYNTGGTRTLTTNTYDAADRLATSKDVLNNITQYAYDPAGNLISKTDANGHTTKYEYDALNRRTALIDANGYRTEQTYDRAGHLVAVKNPNGEVTKFTYDPLGRQTALITHLGFQTQSQYDANGNPIKVLDANLAANSAWPHNTQSATVYRTSTS